MNVWMNELLIVIRVKVECDGEMRQCDAMCDAMLCVMRCAKYLAVAVMLLVSLTLPSNTHSFTRTVAFLVSILVDVECIASVALSVIGRFYDNRPLVAPDVTQEEIYVAVAADEYKEMKGSF